MPIDRFRLCMLLVRSKYASSIQPPYSLNMVTTGRCQRWLNLSLFAREVEYWMQVPITACVTSCDLKYASSIQSPYSLNMVTAGQCQS